MSLSVLRKLQCAEGLGPVVPLPGFVYFLIVAHLVSSSILCIRAGDCVSGAQRNLRVVVALPNV